jgi:halimadienyl-diphosphate synthase
MILRTDTAMPDTLILDRLDDVLSITGDIHDRLGGHGVMPAAYNTGWTARIKDAEGQPAFPKTLDWLVANQRDDGSWGSDVHQEYDRYLNTLSAAIALKEWDHHPTGVSMAEAYLTEAMSGLSEDKELRGSDHLVANLMSEARTVGLDLPYERSPHKPYSLVKRMYLAYVHLDEEHPMGFYSELLGRMINRKRVVKKTQGDDGSLCSDTAATASSLVLDPNQNMDHSYYSRLRFLDRHTFPDGGVRHFGEFEIMEQCYDLFHLLYVEPRSPKFYEVAMKLLREDWTETGLPYSYYFKPADLDCTGLAYRVLVELGHEPDPHCIDRYWKDDHWTVYIKHDVPHACANIHALEATAVSTHPDKDERVDRTVKYLRSRMIDGNHFLDEWHLSPTYPTSHVIRAFHLTEETLMERCLDFLLNTQKEDGSWGFVNNTNGNGLGTLEETGFALQGLLYYHSQVAHIDPLPIRRGVEYLVDRYPPAKFPAMWVAKVLYCPVNIIEGIIEGALLMYKQNFGGNLDGI